MTTVSLASVGGSELKASRFHCHATALVAGIPLRRHGLASLSEMAGTSPAMTAEKYRLPQRHRRVPLVTSPRGPNLGKTGDSG